MLRLFINGENINFAKLDVGNRKRHVELQSSSSAGAQAGLNASDVTISD